MPQERTTNVDARGNLIGWGAATTIDRSEEIERDRWKREKGLAGIAKAGAASKPENKAALESHMKEWKAARAANTGQKAAVEATATKKKTSEMSSDDMIEEAAQGYKKK